MEGLLREGLLDHEVAGVGVGAFDEAEAFADLLGDAQHRHGAADHHAVFRRVHRRDAKIGETAAVLDAVGDASTIGEHFGGDRKSVVSGKSVSVRVDLCGRVILKKTNTPNNYTYFNTSKN